MDTPDRNVIGTPISKFEDSPVFNYINSLSPIKPVKSLNVAQTFNSLSFASPPSVFSSPHVSSQKESRFLKRHYFSGPSKPKLPSDNGDEGNTSVGVLDSVKVSDSSVDPTENFDPGSSIIEVIDDPTNENLELPIELSRTLRYDCGSPEMNPVPIKTNPTTIQFVQEVSVERCHSFQTAMDFQGMHQLEKTKEEGTGCDWDNLISDATDLLIFESSNDAEASEGQDQKIVEPEASYFTSLVSKLPRVSTDDMQKAQPVVQVGSCNQHEMKDVAAQLSEVGEHKETDSTPQIFSSTFQNKQEVNFPLEKMDEVRYHIPFGCKQQRGIRRRCLVFEMSGAQKKKFEDESNSSSSVSSQSDGKFILDNKQFPIRPGTGSSPCMLPGIGLHLNALASSTKDLRIVKHETLASGKQLISMPISMASFHSSSEQKTQNKSLALSSMEKDMVPGDSELQIMQDNSRPSAFKVGEELNDSSPKKKRRRVDHDGESEACKRCNCKKSKCLKLYCECFAAGVYCVEPCSCQECFNKPIHEDTVLATRRQIESRNPLAFAPKVIRSSEPVPEIGEESNKTPASARHKRGCNCKKSSCLKKYCECYQGGVGCSINCRCEGCKNAFGRKDGSTSIGTEEVEPEEEEAETGEKYGVDLSSQNSGVHNDEDQYQDHVLPITFSFQICRTSVQLPFSSFGNLPQSSQPPQPEFEKKFHIFPEDGTPEILRDNGSPISGVKTVSPNRKRVSPPHSKCVSSPGRRSSRKLVLQSIPSFPSLTHHETDDFQ